MPLSARIYFVGACLAGSFAIAVSGLMARPLNNTGPLELALFILAAAIAGGHKVRIPGKFRHDEVSSISLGFTMTFASILMYGPAFSVTIAVVSCLSACLFPKRQPAHHLAFNVALGSLEAFVTGYVYLTLNNWTLLFEIPRTLLAVLGMTATFFVVNTFGVAIIVALCSSAKLLTVWKKNFSWVAPSYFASASVGVLGPLIWKQNLAWVIFLTAPVAWLTYQSFCAVVSRGVEENQLRDLSEKQSQSAALYLSTIKSLALAIDAKDQFARRHIVRVQRYAVATAIELGITGAELEAINTGALLHDIGKLGIPEYILMKSGRLTPSEYEKVRMHVEIGEAILESVEFPWPVLPIVRHHHERWDGLGYPDGLAGTEIPLTARVVAVCDVYDALTTPRAYRTAWNHDRAIETIRAESGKQFDPAVVRAFLRVIDGVLRNLDEPTDPSSSASTRAIAGAENLAEIAISRSSTELWALYEVGQALSSSMSTEETIDLLSEKLLAIFPAGLVVFLIAGSKDGLLRTGIARGVNAEFFQFGHSAGVDSLSRRSLERRAIYCGPFDPNDIALNSSASPPWRPLRTCAIVPIWFGGEPLGTMNVYDERESAFSDHDVQLLGMIGERSAPALFNGALFDRVRGDAMRDSLTGLHNVRYLTEFIDARCRAFEAAAGYARPFAILCLDLDNFKPINDNFGHQKGDQVLRDLAAIFLRVAGPDAKVARYGGDEFVIVLDEADREPAVEMVHAIRAAVDAYEPGLIHFRLGRLRIGVSIGIAVCPEDGADCASLISVADVDMYRNKSERKLETLAKSSVMSRGDLDRHDDFEGHEGIFEPQAQP